MVALTWGPGVTPRYENGVNQGVLYIPSAVGVAWSGLVSVQQTNDGGDVQSYYRDGVKYLDVVENTDYEAVITAISEPREFLPCYGYVSLRPGFVLTKQPRQKFSLSYRVMNGTSGYKIHLVYNATATLTKRKYETFSDRTSLTILEWKIAAVPPASSTFKPTSHVVIDSTKVNSTKLNLLEQQLYGNLSSTTSNLPTQSTVITMLT